MNSWGARHGFIQQERPQAERQYELKFSVSEELYHKLENAKAALSNCLGSELSLDDFERPRASTLYGLSFYVPLACTPLLLSAIVHALGLPSVILIIGIGALFFQIIHKRAGDCSGVVLSGAF